MALHRALDGAGPEPLALLLSRLCEEFHCRPTEAYEELLAAPVGLIAEILEARYYARAKQIVDGWDANRIPAERRMTGAIFTVVQQVEAQIIREARDARG